MTVAVEVILDDSAYRLERHYVGDAGFDLAASESRRVYPGEFVDVPTGVRISMPDGIWCRLVGRSSTLRKHGLLVSEGIIDTGYQGELYVGVFNPSSTPIQVEPGQRFAQLVFHHLVVPEVQYVDSGRFSVTRDRGMAGFGSTGQQCGSSPATILNNTRGVK